MHQFLYHIENNVAYFKEFVEMSKVNRRKETEITKVAFCTNFKAPTKNEKINYKYPMTRVDEKDVPWLAGISLKTGEHVQIFSGIELSDFLKTIIEHNGKVFVKTQDF